jgi:hypothetical protein
MMVTAKVVENRGEWVRRGRGIGACVDGRHEAGEDYGGGEARGS